MEFNDIVDSISIKPYYLDREAGQVIYCSDNRLILPLIPDKSIDLVLADPPYKDDYLWCYDLLSQEGEQLLKESSLLFAYCGTMYLPEVIVRLTRNLNWVWLFNLQNAQFSRIWSSKIMQTSKPLICVSQGKPRPLNWLRTDFRAEGADKEIYSWQQAQEAPSIVISKTTESEDIILDPFLGSGTTLVCAKKLGRKGIGIEVEEKYCRIAVERLRQSVMKLIV